MGNYGRAEDSRRAHRRKRFRKNTGLASVLYSAQRDSSLTKADKESGKQESKKKSGPEFPAFLCS
jgi:hypothetical protein